MTNPKLSEWEANPNTLYPRELCPEEWNQMVDEGKKLVSEIFQLFEKRRASSAAPEVLHHYTSGYAALQIIQNNKIWLSDYQYSNDRTEGKIAEDLIWNYLNENLDDKTRLALISKKEHWEEISERMHPFSRTFYIACFSEEADSLLQWLSYGEKGKGYELSVWSNHLTGEKEASEVFQHTDSHPMLKDHEKPLPVALRKVIYSKEQQVSETKLVSELLSRFCSKWVLVFADYEPVINRFYGHFWGNCVSVMENLAPDYKDIAFGTEKEWRCMISTDNTAAFNYEPYVRFANGRFIPYLQISAQVTAVRSGPAADYVSLFHSFGGKKIPVLRKGLGNLLSIRKSDTPLK